MARREPASVRSGILPLRAWIWLCPHHPWRRAGSPTPKPARAPSHGGHAARPARAAAVALRPEAARLFRSRSRKRSATGPRFFLSARPAERTEAPPPWRGGRLPTQAGGPRGFAFGPRGGRARGG